MHTYISLIIYVLHSILYICIYIYTSIFTIIFPSTTIHTCIYLYVSSSISLLLSFSLRCSFVHATPLYLSLYKDVCIHKILLSRGQWNHCHPKHCRSLRCWRICIPRILQQWMMSWLKALRLGNEDTAAASAGVFSKIGLSEHGI